MCQKGDVSMIKIAAIGIVSVFLAMLAGNVKKEYGVLTAIAASVLIFSYGITGLSAVVSRVREFENTVGITHEYVVILLKLAGIACVSQFAVSLCKDSGQSMIAGQVAFVSRLSMLTVSFPVLEALVRTIGDLMQ